LELCESAFAKDPELASVKDYVEDSGEGRWTVQEAIERNVPAPVLMLSLFARVASRQDSSFSAKVIAALRNEFGGHAVKKE
jgi:6-phosphogluconate dehydrogenase